MKRAVALTLFLLIPACDSAESGGQSRKGPAAPATGPVVATLSPPDLWREFGYNELAAKRKYAAGRVKLIGSVDAVQEDAQGPFVGFTVYAAAGVSPLKLKTMSELERKWFMEGYPPQVICYMSRDAAKVAEKIQKNTPVEVAGRVVGRKADPTVPKEYVVILDGCTVAILGKVKK